MPDTVASVSLPCHISANRIKKIKVKGHHMKQPFLMMIICAMNKNNHMS